MLFVIGWVHKKHRRLRSAVCMGLMCALCIERLAAMHSPTHAADGSLAASAAAGSVEGWAAPTPAGFTPLSLRLQAWLGAETDPALAGAAILGLPGDGLAADLIPDIPMASR